MGAYIRRSSDTDWKIATKRDRKVRFLAGFLIRRSQVRILPGIFEKHGKTLLKSQPQGVPEWCSKVAKVVGLPPFSTPKVVGKVVGSRRRRTPHGTHSEAS